MKKRIESSDMLSKFENKSLLNLAGILGGTEVPPTTSTAGYDTHSSASDSDQGDHDSDASPSPAS